MEIFYYTFRAQFFLSLVHDFVFSLKNKKGITTKNNKKIKNKNKKGIEWRDQEKKDQWKERFIINWGGG